MILLAGASANADCTYDLSVTLERYSPGENHDTSGIGDMDSKKLATGLGVFRQILGCDVESARRVRFVNRNIYTADAGAVHSHVCHEVCAFVHNSNVHRLSDFHGLFLRGRNYPSSVVEGDHTVYFEAFCTSARRRGSQGAETELLGQGNALDTLPRHGLLVLCRESAPGMRAYYPEPVGRTGPDGKFRVCDFTPGEYTVSAHHDYPGPRLPDNGSFDLRHRR
jgi:hypothetical protein